LPAYPPRGLTIHSSCPEFAVPREVKAVMFVPPKTRVSPIRDARGYDDVAAAAAEALLIMDWIIRKPV
jgi:hypothetical protein